MARLESICSMNMGQSPDSSSYNETGEGIPFFQGNADFGEMNPQVRVWCSAPTKIAHNGDILISVRAPIGALNIANTECCIGRGLAALTVNEKVCEKKYLWYGITSKVDELNFKGTGSTFKAISKNVLAETEIPLPSMERQQQIAATLDKVTDLISLRKKQLAKLDKLVKSQFIEMFGDPVMNPRVWEVRSFSEIATSRLGKMLDGKKQTGLNTYPYLANFNVQWFRFNLENLNTMDFDPADQKEFEIRRGDLLVCEGGEIGRCAIWNCEIENCFFQKAIHRVRCNTEVILPEYLARVLYYRYQYNGFEDVVGSKSTIAHLTGEKLKTLSIVVPPLDLQNQFAAFVKQVDKSKFEIQKSLDKLETLKKALMQKYFG